MGSLVVSEVVHDIGAHYTPPRMLTGTPRVDQPQHRSHSQQSSGSSRPTTDGADNHSRISQRTTSTSQTTLSSDATVTDSHNEHADSRPSTAASSTIPSRPESTTSSQPSAAAATPKSSPQIKIRNLEHIQSIASDTNSPMNYLNTPQQSPPEEASPPPQYEISGMPVADVIEMVAGLLTKITSTNDHQAEHLHRNIPGPDAAAGLSSQTSSVLAFHGKNVPTISIMSYLSRIHKYCPATYEVFLSLLVYFDRITEKVNASPLQNLRQANEESPDSETSSSNHEATDRQAQAPAPGEPTPSSSQSPVNAPRHHSLPDRSASSGLPSPPLTDSDPLSLAHFFVVDSFNIHRLVIAGVTCASKFFSDVFYTNSRYAKVSLPGITRDSSRDRNCANALRRLAVCHLSSSTISSCNSSYSMTSDYRSAWRS